MANRVSLKAAPRLAVGRTALKQTRASGLVPAILYAKGKSEPMEINAVELANMLNSATSEHMLVNLEVKDSKKRLALVQDLQRHPLKDTVVHIDFHEIDENEKIHVEVPVIEVGEAIGVRTGGGVMDHALRTLRLECLPKDLPEKIMVDVSNLEVGKAIHVGEIAIPPNTTVLNAKDLPVFAVHAPKVVEEVAPATTEQASPEVIKEKKDEGAPEAAPEKGEKGKGDKAKAPEKGAEKAGDKGGDKEKKK